MQLKSGVNVQKLTPQTLLAMLVTDQAYKEFGLELVVTSIYRGGKENLLHDNGEAFDARLPSRCGRHATLHNGDLDEAVFQRIKQMLGGAGAGYPFDCVLERFPGAPSNDHIHIEYDPR
jgi:hypothetical protein